MRFVRAVVEARGVQTRLAFQWSLSSATRANQAWLCVDGILDLVRKLLERCRAIVAVVDHLAVLDVDAFRRRAMWRIPEEFPQQLVVLEPFGRAL